MRVPVSFTKKVKKKSLRFSQSENGEQEEEQVRTFDLFWSDKVCIQMYFEGAFSLFHLFLKYLFTYNVHTPIHTFFICRQYIFFMKVSIALWSKSPSI